jgi:hypothetical protein
MGEQQPQRRDDTVHGRHGNASLALGDLELRTSSAVAVLGDRFRNVAKRPTSRM